LFASLALLSSVALADKATTDADLKVSYELPAGWKTVRQDPTVLAVADSTDEVTGWLISVDAKNDPEAAIKQIDQLLLLPKIPDLKRTMGPASGKINGLDAVHFKAEGKLKEGNEPVRLGEMVLKTPSGKYLIVILATKAKTFDKHRTEVNAFINSIKPVK